jgi:hypothetical protein
MTFNAKNMIDDGDWHVLAPYVEYGAVSAKSYRGRIIRFDHSDNTWHWQTCAHKHLGKDSAIACAEALAVEKN